jgi:Caspase domain
MRRALIIGINHYIIGSSLNGCINDAQIISNVLKRHGNQDPNFGITELFDCSKKDIKERTTQLFASSCETALFYFAGHGFIDSTGGYIIANDSDAGDDGISMDWLLGLANNSRATNKVIVLDCCHSGAFGNPRTSNAKTTQLAEGVSILTASRDSEPALEKNGNGVFTTLLHDALKGGASDLRGHVTIGSIYAYIDQALGAWDQRPIFKTNVTNFTSLREVKPPIPLNILRKITTYFPEPYQEFPLDPSFEFTCTNLAKEENINTFTNLQKFASVGLVIPIDEEHMYFAAMNSKGCKLTALGHQYWRLVNQDRL